MKSLTTTKEKIAYSVLFAFTLALFLSDDNLDFSEGDNILFHNGPIVTMDQVHPPLQVPADGDDAQEDLMGRCDPVFQQGLAHILLGPAPS